MHELGIIMQVNKALIEIAAENNVQSIASVTLEIGEVSGIVPSYFEDCWKYFRQKSELLKQAELHLEMIEGVTYCNVCKQVYETKKYGKTCPFCHQEDTYLLQGNECTIKEIEAEA